MNDRLHEIIGQCAMIHENNIKTDIINDLEKIEDNLEDVEDDVREHYLMLLMQYYFQNNNLDNLQKLLLQGYRFDIRFNDIKEAFIHIKNGEDNVIEFYEDTVVLLKDSISEEDFKAMYDYYHENEQYREFLEQALEFIRKNRYVCAHAYKSKNEFSKFFLNGDLLESIKRDMPFLLR